MPNHKLIYTGITCRKYNVHGKYAANYNELTVPSKDRNVNIK